MPEPPKQPVDIPFPISGIVEGSSHSQQPLNTTWDAKNVVPFDPEEDRARGGRRNGVERVTGLPVSSERLQMVRSVGVVPGDANTMVGGGLAKWSDEVDSENKYGNLPYQELDDGTPLTSDRLGHTFYGDCTTWVDSATRPGSSHGWSLFDTDPMGMYNDRSFWTSSSTGTNAWNNQNGESHSGFTKQTDGDGAAYISINPCKFPVAKYDEPSTNTFQYVIDNYNGDGGAFPIAGDPPGHGSAEADGHMQVHKHFSLVPEMFHGESPWNSSPGREFVSRVEFKVPKTHLEDISEDNVIAPGEQYGGAGFEFQEDKASVTSDFHFYDPYYHQCMTHDGNSWYASNGGEGNQLKFYDQLFKWGFILRVKFDSSDSQMTNAWENTNNNNPLAVLMSTNGRYLDLNCFPLTQSTTQSNAISRWRYLAHNFVRITDDIHDGGFDLDAYHTLEVRLKGNKLDVALDGIIRFSLPNVVADDSEGGASGDWTQYIADTESTDTATTYGYSTFVYEVNTHFHDKNSTSGMDSDANGKRFMAYAATRDFTHQKGTGDLTAKEVWEGDEHRSGDRSDELRVRRLEWLEGGELLSVPQNTIAVGGGFIYGSPGQTEFSRISTKQDLNASQNMVNAVEHFQKMYFVDGENYKVYEPSISAVAGTIGTISDWNAANGDLPGGDGSTGVNGSGTSDGNARCPIITTWLGRIVLAGKGDDPQNWFMSAVGDPLDWDYLTGSDETGAVKGSSTRQFGEMASAVTALIPFSGTKLLIGGISSLHMLTGDPLWPDTQQHSLSFDVGIVGPEAWCYGPGNSVYFMGENGLYLLMPNDYDISQTDRLSAGKFDKTFGGVDFDSSTTMLAYDHEKHGVHIFVTPNSQQVGAVAHFYYDRRSDSFWKMEYPAIIGPTAVYDFKSQSPGSRRILMGGFDGHIRSFSETAKTDDGTAIDSYVWLGPIQTSSTREAKLTELIAVLDRESADVNYSIHVADSVEEAKQAEAVHSSTWSSGRNASHRMRARGSAIFIKLYNNSSNLPWVYERLTATLAVAGKVRDR